MEDRTDRWLMGSMERGDVEGEGELDERVAVYFTRFCWVALSGLLSFSLIPRALPWASLGRPFGASEPDLGLELDLGV